MKYYITPDMAVYERSLIREYEAHAASVTCSSGVISCSSQAVSCKTDALGSQSCQANSAGCGAANHCTKKSS